LSRKTDGLVIVDVLGCDRTDAGPKRRCIVFRLPASLVTVTVA
jgi:hypothetical protein